jgi:5-formyltetrahydrofolate cyclo-ligase
MTVSKTELRHRCRHIREAMSADEVSAGSRAVCDHLSRWPIFVRANTVLGFIAFRNEVDLSPLVKRWPQKRWLAPRVVEDAELAPGQKPHLVLHLYLPGHLTRHRFGMLEPLPTLPKIDPSEVDVILVPGVAFDLKGGRLGYGGGFYDRLLPLASRAVCIGVAFEQQVLAEIPMEPWDCRVGWLVTPAGITQTV